LAHTTTSEAALCGRLGMAVRMHGPQSDEAKRARRDLEAARLASHIQRVVASAPPLTAKQVAHLRALLPPCTPDGQR